MSECDLSLRKKNAAKKGYFADEDLCPPMILNWDFECFLQSSKRNNEEMQINNSNILRLLIFLEKVKFEKIFTFLSDLLVSLVNDPKISQLLTFM